MSAATTLASTSTPSFSHAFDSSAPHPEYLDLNFELPEKRYVGCLACQRDPLLSSLNATVLRSDKVQKAATAAAEGKGKKAKKTTEVEEELWEIELNDTPCFPEGGGQNSDTGSLVPLSSSGSPIESSSALIRSVFRRNLDAVHLVTRPFPVGSQVLVRVDFERRTDLMSQHTAQHLLSAILENDFQIDTVSWSLATFPEMSYIELPRVPTREEIERVERRCNELIRERRRVKVRMELVSEEDGVELNEKAPRDYRDDEGGERRPVQRTVIIDGVDENPCCGTHYPDLSYLQSIFLSPFTTPIRGTNCRLYFVSGPRILHHLSTSHQIARNAALEAGCKPLDLAERVEGMVSTLAEIKRREKRLKEELAGHVAKELWDNAIKESQEGSMIAGMSFREEESTNSLDFLSLVSIDLTSRYNALNPSSSSLPRKYLFLLAVGDTPGSTSPTNGAVLILGSEDLVVKAGKLVVEKLKGKVKGGGKGRWQGKLTDKWVAGDREKLEDVVKEAI
ncbi:putative alanine--tRNA ligase [Sporobolomyces salmoneus]|uniref:putative alanine--tRNA ligase n=1 Tax=Sporobolomyces salmoneus TaxID=183962 RepID=UPI00316C3626